MSRKPIVKSRDFALWGGAAAVAIGSFLLYDAFERRGKQRPWIMRLLPGA